MAIAYRAYLGAFTWNTNRTSASVTTLAAVPAGDTVVFEFAAVLGLVTVVSVTDSSGNGYSPLNGFAQGSTYTGSLPHCHGRLHLGRIDTALPAGSSITITFSTNISHGAIQAHRFSGLTHPLAASGAAANGSSATSPSLAQSVQHLHLLSCATGSSVPDPAPGMTPASSAGPGWEALAAQEVTAPAPTNTTIKRQTWYRVLDGAAVVSGNTVTLAPGRNWALVSLTATGPLTGGLLLTVLDYCTGLPIAGATVALTDSAGAPQTLVTDSSGQVFFDNLAHGTGSYQITAGGYPTRNNTFFSLPPTTGTFTERLTPVGGCPDPGALVVTVRDWCDNAALAGASVTVGGTVQTTDGSGETTFTGLAPATYPVSVTLSGYGAGSGSGVVPAGGTGAETVWLTPTGGCPGGGGGGPGGGGGAGAANLHNRWPYYWRAESTGTIIRVRRADYLKPPYANDVPVSVGPGDHSPALGLVGERLLLLFKRGAAGDVYEQRSDDDGGTWSSAAVAFSGGKWPVVAVHPQSGLIIRAALVGTNIKLTRQEPGDVSPQAELTVKDETGANIAFADERFDLSWAPDGSGQLLLTAKASGGTSISDWTGRDDGATFKLIT